MKLIASAVVSYSLGPDLLIVLICQYLLFLLCNIICPKEYNHMQLLVFEGIQFDEYTSSNTNNNLVDSISPYIWNIQQIEARQRTLHLKH